MANFFITLLGIGIAALLCFLLQRFHFYAAVALFTIWHVRLAIYGIIRLIMSVAGFG